MAYLIEMRVSGQYVRVAAIDPETNTEVVTVGPKNIGEEALKRAAVRKLEYVLKKKKNQQSG